MKAILFLALAARLGVLPFVKAAPATYVCDYKTYSDEAGLHQVTKPFVLTFVLNASTKKAYMVGNNGTSEVQSFLQDSGVTLVEVTDVGNVMVTAIASSGKSVHSRTGILLGEIVPSQYYGVCKRQ